MIAFTIILLAASSSVTLGFIYVEEYKLDYYPEVVNKSELVKFSDKTQSFAGNYTFELIKTVNKFKIYLFINLPENENDRQFRKELIKTVIDSNKFFNDIYANSFARYVMRTILPAAQFEFKLPFKPGVYRFVNLLAPDPPFPWNQWTTTAICNFRVVGNIDGKKKSVFISNLWFRGGLQSIAL